MQAAAKAGQACLPAPAPPLPHLAPSCVRFISRSASPCLRTQGMMDTTQSSAPVFPSFCRSERWRWQSARRQGVRGSGGGQGRAATACAQERGGSQRRRGGAPTTRLRKDRLEHRADHHVRRLAGGAVGDELRGARLHKVDPALRLRRCARGRRQRRQGGSVRGGVQGGGGCREQDAGTSRLTVHPHPPGSRT